MAGNATLIPKFASARRVQGVPGRQMGTSVLWPPVHARGYRHGGERRARDCGRAWLAVRPVFEGGGGRRTFSIQKKLLVESHCNYTRNNIIV